MDMTPIGFDHYVDHRRQWSYISSEDTSKVIYLSQMTQVRQDLTAVLITRDSGASNTDIRMDVSTNSMEGNNDEMWFLDDDYLVEDEEQLVDKGEHDVPQQLVTADAHAQRDVHLGLYEQQPASGQDHVTKFKASGVKGMWMSMLQSMHDNKRAMAAVGLLRQQHQIMMDNMQMRALPFNPEGWMMVLGTCMDEQLWLAMAPNMYFEEGYGENREEVVPVLESKTMVLSMEHRDGAHMGKEEICTSYWLSHMSGIHHVMMVLNTITLHISLDMPFVQWRATTLAIIGRFEEWHWNIKLRLNDMKAFHRHFINSWAEWVRKAPASWKQDGFLVENMPVGVCLQYGQNQPIMVSQALEEERTNWSRDQNFSYLDVQRWHNVSLERIMWNHGEVYDKPAHDPSRVAVDLRELDLLDEDGYEINVYNKAGWRVPRRVPKESQSCGALLDLDKVHELFQGRDEVHGEMMNEVEFWVYPLAFTQKYGNVKAHGIIPNMAGCVGKLNKSIFRGGMEDDDMDVDEGGEDRVWLARRNPAIHGIASQIYNSLLHQLGMITSAFAGAGIEMAGGRCRSIYEEIICPLLKAWSHPQVLGPIKDSLKLFKPDIIPELFKCAMYPVTALIEMFWAKHKQDLQDKRNIDACTIEVMSMLEQTLNFAHTGNAAVLSTRLMDRAWLSLGLLSDGFPALSDTFIAHGALSMGQVMVRQHEWPVEAETQWPMMSSKWAQQLTYGKAHYEAYEAKFTIKLAIENLPPNAYSHISNASFRQACYAADVAFRVYFDDVKKLSNSAMAYQALQAIQAGDARGEWSAMDVQLTSFDTVLHKINLPSDWALAHIIVEGMPEYILDGYRFMQNTYDGAKPLHQLAMISAKGINVFLLVHLGLVLIEMASGFRSAKWTVDIKPCGGDKIVMQHAEVVRLMKSGGMYGGFDVVQYLAGMKAANILQMNQFMTA
ncbi:hypothetical protein EDC04DRAFT_2600374 [Pisolithus marmoratus]|nr:hypothetical protein EDC04DRAFT_2600374 [Pisolithus marmoratus]